MAKFAARPRHRRPPAEAAAGLQAWDAGPRVVVRSLRAAGVDTLRAPEAAVMDFIDSRAPPPPKRRRAPALPPARLSRLDEAAGK